MVFRIVLLCLLAGMQSACRSPADPPSESEGESLTLLEEHLLRAIKAEKQLDEEAARPDPDPREVQRRFQQIARDYAGIIARNPRHLESRLLYGKLLARYGDREGARDQFLMAAHIDPKVAVIHQQLGNYFAEEGDHTRALAYTLNAIELEPETAAYHFGLGQLLFAFRDEFLKDELFAPDQIDQEMLRAFLTAKDLEPETLPLQFRYGEASYDVADPDWEAALAHWESLATRDDLTPIQADSIRLHRARCLIERGRANEAMELINAVNSPELRASAESLLPEQPDSPDNP